MSKYHISPKTGRTNICRAQKQCPLGDIPHFDSKEKAEAFLQESLEKAYSTFNSKDKDTEDFLSRITIASDIDANAYDVESYLKSLAPGEEMTFSDVIEEPDYFNQVLVERKGKYYVARTSGGDYSAFNLLSFTQVEKTTIEQPETTAIELPKVTQLNDTLKELVQGEYEELKYLIYKDKDSSDYIISASDVIPKEIKRQDGTSIHIFGIRAIGDRNITDAPFPVEVPLEFSENGQRQNAREMDQGFVIFDTRTDTGVLMKWRSASDGFSQDSTYIWNKRSITPRKESQWQTGPGDLFLLQGKNSTKEVSYFRQTGN